jgi:hypothetical protein
MNLRLSLVVYFMIGFHNFIMVWSQLQLICIDLYMISHVESLSHINMHVESHWEPYDTLNKCINIYKWVLMTFEKTFNWSEQVIVWV